MASTRKSKVEINRSDNKTKTDKLRIIKNEYEREIKQLHEEITAIIEEKLKLEDNNADYKEEIHFYKVKCSVIEKDYALLSEQNAEHRRSFKRLKCEIEELRKEINEAKACCNNTTNNANAPNEDKQKVITNAYDVFKDTAFECAIPSVNNPWQSSLESLKSAYIKELSKCEKTISKLEKSNEKFRERVAKLEQSAPMALTQQRKYSQPSQSYNDKVLEVVNIHQTYEQQIFELQNEIKNLDEVCKESMTTVDILQQKNASATEEIKNLPELKETIDTLKSKLLDCETELEKEKTLRQRITSDRDNILGQLELLLKRNHDFAQHSDYRYIF